MTPEEQQQVQAAIGFVQSQLNQAIVAGANLASKCEELAQMLKAANARIESMSKRKKKEAPQE